VLFFLGLFCGKFPFFPFKDSILLITKIDPVFSLCSSITSLQAWPSHDFPPHSHVRRWLSYRMAHFPQTNNLCTLLFLFLIFPSQILILAFPVVFINMLFMTLSSKIIYSSVLLFSFIFFPLSRKFIPEKGPCSLDPLALALILSLLLLSSKNMAHQSSLMLSLRENLLSMMPPALFFISWLQLISFFSHFILSRVFTKGMALLSFPCSGFSSRTLSFFPSYSSRLTGGGVILGILLGLIATYLLKKMFYDPISIVLITLAIGFIVSFLFSSLYFHPSLLKSHDLHTLCRVFLPQSTCLEHLEFLSQES